jgi:RNA polymerase sigma-70 factor (ECF subfamily)
VTADLDHLLPAIVAGDTQAFGTWVSCCEDPLRRALRRFATQVDVEAVLQESLLRVWQVAPRVAADGKGNTLLRMAHRIARNLAIDASRRNKRMVVSEAPPETPLTPSMPDPMLRSVIAQCRAKLPPQPAQALTLRLTSSGGRPDRELAQELSMKLNTFLKNVGRARTLLAACLEKNGVDWGAR